MRNKNMAKKKETFEDWIAGIIREYQPILGLGGHKIQYNISDNYNYLACEFVYPYTTTTIFYNQKVKDDWKECDRLEIERRIVHEMCHVLTDPLYAKAVSRWCSKDEVEDERERLTDLIATVVWRLHNKNK